MSRTLFLLFCLTSSATAAGQLGYYRQPTIHGDTLVFVAEGDLWKVSAQGSTAARLTTHGGDEELPALSPDGKTIAFVGHYEGPAEVYTMPLAGGAPRRLTWDAARITFVGWTPDGKVLVSTNAHATLPAQQLVILDPQEKSVGRKRVPLAQAADGVFDTEGKTLFFTRQAFQGSHTKRYKGGTAQNLWRFTTGDAAARPLTASFAGTSKSPLWWRDRVYFVSDRDGTMNLWSMKPDGGDLKQHTKHRGWDVTSPALAEGRIVYQLGADLHLHDLAANSDRKLSIRLDSDFDQTRERFVKEPADYLSSAHLSPDGSKVVLTARGRVFVVPQREGRLVEVTRKEGVRHRAARFLDASSILSLSDESGEVELWRFPADGLDTGHQLTREGGVLRWDAVPSPDGSRVAHTDKDQRLFLLDVARKEDRKIDESPLDDIEEVRWSPDGKWLAYVVTGDNLFTRIKLHEVATGKSVFATSDRYASFAPAWSPDGKWLTFLSDRNLRSLVSSPWGTYQPEPYLDKKTRLYQLALVEGVRSPFAAPDELHPETKKDDRKDAVKVEIEGLTTRLHQLPIRPGNYTHLQVNDKGLFWLATERDESGGTLQGLAPAHDAEVKTVASGVTAFELSADGKKLLIRKNKSLFIVDANPVAAELAKKEVDLSGWTLSVSPREEWRQMFVEAWRLERDYFYDRGMHGVDWKAVRRKYEPLVERVANRAELSDLVAQMVSELSALHIFVRGGDTRKGNDDVWPAALGAELERLDSAGGYLVVHVTQSDPDEPTRRSPLARPEVNVKAGEIIQQIDGVEVLSVADIGQLLRGKAGRQVRLRIRAARSEKQRDVIVRPISRSAAEDLRYHEWEYTRRLHVEETSKSEIGYVHLRAMGGANFTEWAKGFYPVFTRSGLIVDVRHNRGGNIDSWILGRLLRKAWFYWNRRVGRAPSWNMQYAFRGHLVVLCDEWTASDGEAFCEGVKRLKLGTVIGTRTWGGEIWLRADNFLVDRGIATSAEFGVFGPEGAWLIEGHGVEPDVVVDNEPHATFQGKDAQLDAAVKFLQRKIREQPVELPSVPKFPRPGADK